MGRALAHIQQQWHINHGQEIYCVKLASSVSMLDADRVCSSDRGVVSHLSMPPLVPTACASNLFFFSPPSAFLESLFCKIKTSPSPRMENWRTGTLTAFLPARWARCFMGARGRREHLSLPQRQHGLHSGGKNDMKQMQIQRLPGASHFLLTGSLALAIKKKYLRISQANAIFLAAVPSACARLCHQTHATWAGATPHSALPQRL